VARDFVTDHARERLEGASLAERSPPTEVEGIWWMHIHHTLIIYARALHAVPADGATIDISSPPPPRSPRNGSQ